MDEGNSSVAIWGRRVVIYYKKLLEGLSQAYGIDSDVPYEALSDEFREVLLQGSGSVEIEYYMRRRLQRRPFEGVIPMLMRRLENNESEGMSHWLRDYMICQACPACGELACSRRYWRVGFRGEIFERLLAIRYWTRRTSLRG